MKKVISILFIVIVALVGTKLNAQIRLVAVNPATGTVSIKNFGTVAINISSHRLCHLFTYPIISSLTVVTGNTNLMPGATVVVTGVGLNATASDLAIYLPSGVFTDPNNMLDFVQWGSAGNGRESVAVSKGIWDAGTFISVAPPYQYTGDGLQQFGVTFWQTLTSINQNNLDNKIAVYPNPVLNKLTINSDVKLINYKVLNSLGELVFEKNDLYLKKMIQIPFSNFDNGNYILYLNTEKGLVTKKITVIK